MARNLSVENPRLVAFDLLQSVNWGGAYANLELPKILKSTNLNQSDKGFVTELSYGTLRMQGKYDFYISQFSDRRLSDIDRKLLDLLRLGCHQIFAMRVPNHAAIYETIEITKKVAGQSKASFANAILRKVSEISDEEGFIKIKVKDHIQYLSIFYSHPEWIINSFFDQLKDWQEVEKLLAANNLPAKPNLIAWPNLSDTDELVKEGCERIPFTNFGVIANNPPESIKAIKERRAGVQDAGSQYLTEIFYATRTEEDQEFLDLCAAPGGKAKLLYELLDHKHFQANEVNANRLKLLNHLIPENYTSNFDGTDSSQFGRKYDRILIDAPCTGLAALRRRPEARWRKSQNDLKELIKIQRDLISSAYKMLKPNGIIGYATCSPHLLETKVQVADALNRFKDLELISIGALESKYHKGLQSDGTMQLWTHRDQTDSMFLALMKLRND